MDYRCDRSQSPRIGSTVPTPLNRRAQLRVLLSRNPLESGQPFLRLKDCRCQTDVILSQSPRIGSTVPTQSSDHGRFKEFAMSQSPRIGSTVPTHLALGYIFLIDQYVAIPSNRVNRSYLGIIMSTVDTILISSQSPRIGSTVPT